MTFDIFTMYQTPPANKVYPNACVLINPLLLKKIIMSGKAVKKYDIQALNTLSSCSRVVRLVDDDLFLVYG